jgi:hypothetical protein
MRDALQDVNLPRETLDPATAESAEADDDRRKHEMPHLHRTYLSLRRANDDTAMSAATIQNRSVIFDSGIPRNWK